MSASRTYTCFFIAQMSTDEDMERLKRIASELLEPILKPLGYTIITPDEPSGSASIFKFVMKMLDIADLLVADLTNDNPNVYYELSIRHSLGLPYALISQHGIRFDIAGLRYIKYDPNDLKNKKMRQDLKTYLVARHADVLKKGDVDNPINNFYGAPLAEVSPASGLGLGYYRNFINFGMRDIRNPKNIIRVNGKDISEQEQQDIRLEIWLPSLLSGAFPNNVSSMLVTPGKLHKAEIEVPNYRRIPLYARIDSTQPIVLVDVPTAMNAMEVAILSRYSDIRLDRKSNEWLRLEQQEIERFRDTIKRLLRNETDLLIQNNVSMVNWDIVTGELTPIPFM